MASTLLDIITRSLRKIGQAGIGQSVSAEQGAQGMDAANSMLGKWSIQKLMLFYVATRTYNLSATVQDYAIGPTGIVGGETRPIFIESGLAVTPGSAMENTMSVIDKPGWNAIRDKGASCSLNGTPADMWVEYGFPNLTLHFHPIPSNTVTVKLGSWERLQLFTSLFDELAFPEGYEEAIVWNLAMELAPEYDQPTAPLAQYAADGINSIRGINAMTLTKALGEAQTLNSPNTGQPVPTGA